MDERVLAGFALDEPAADDRLRTGRSLLDGSAVVVELLAVTDPALAARAELVRASWLRADGRHLVRVRQLLVSPEEVAVVRDAVDGGDLEGERLRAGGTLVPAAAAAVVADVLDAVADLHAAGLVHGDLVPEAVRLDASVPLRPVVRLTGWGTAALRGRATAPQDDVAAAGRLLVHLLTGSADGALEPAVARALEPVLGPLLAGAAPAGWGRDGLRAAALAGLPAQPPVVPVPVLPVQGDGPALLSAPAAAPAARRGARLPLPAVLGLSLLVVLALVAATAAVVLPRYRELTTALAPGAAGPTVPQPYALAPLQRADGLVVERTWVLEQDGAVLRGTTVVTNLAGSPRSAGVDEVVPKSVADDVDDLVFTPGPDAIVQRDPVVRFNLRDVQPGESRSWEFVVTLPAPLVEADLPRLADDAEQARLAYEEERRRLLEELRASSSPDPDGD